MHDTTPQAEALGQHQMVAVHEDAWRCTACGTVATQQYNPRCRYGIKQWMDWRALDDRTWMTVPGEPAPSCPPPPVEALCPWDDRAMRYAGAKGDVQLDTATRTWCERHEMAVADCPEPGPYCYGWQAHEEMDGSGCTGRQESCRCMCPACCGDTPDVWGYDGPY
ncbi:hypothetical protein [Streptomyces lydicus]|uniref:hypothetical protein n=1 Tax=Streptomyces lydicus TaxID=47763 RepID=UPI0037A1B934